MDKMQLIEKLKDVKTFEYLLMFENDLADYNIELSDYISYICEDEIDYIIENRLNSSGWQSVYYTIKGLDWLADEYYMFDGYGNLKCINIEDVECVVYDLIKELED